MGAPGQDGYLI